MTDAPSQPLLGSDSPMKDDELNLTDHGSMNDSVKNKGLREEKLKRA